MAIQNNDLPTDANVNAAIRWSRTNAQMIADIMPLHTPGLTFSDAWLAGALARYIQLWESGELGLALAVAYIVCLLRKVKIELNKLSPAKPVVTANNSNRTEASENGSKVTC